MFQDEGVVRVLEMLEFSVFGGNSSGRYILI